MTRHRRGHGPPETPAQDNLWLNLTDLGRIYGVSAVHCGRLLAEAGLRDSHGQPTRSALRRGCASAAPTHWHREHCSAAFERAGLAPVRRVSLVQQWAELLSALIDGSPSISTSAGEMAQEIPGELVEPVNAELRERGCSFQVPPRRARRGHRSGPTAADNQSMRRREERGTARPGEERRSA